MQPWDTRAGLEALLAEEAWARRLAHGLVGAHDGDELTQSVLLKALRRPPGLLGSIRGYWKKALKNEASNLRRDRGRRQGRERAAALPESSAPDALDVMERIEQRRMLAEHLIALPTELRHVLVLHYEEQRTTREIARLLGVPSSTIRARLIRGRELLRERLQRADPHWYRGIALLARLQTAPATATPLPLLVAWIMKTPILVSVSLLAFVSVLGIAWLWSTAPAAGNAGSRLPALALPAFESDSPESTLDPPTASAPSTGRTPGVAALASPGKERVEPATTFPELPEFRVTARLLDEQGLALPMARLTLNAPGGHELEPDPEGRIDARVSRAMLSDEGSFQWSADDPQGRYKWGAASVGEQGVVALGDIRLVPVARFHGRVVDTQGRGLGGVSVLVRTESANQPFDNGTIYHGGRSDENGRFDGHRLEGGLSHWHAGGRPGYAGTTGWSSPPVSARLELGATVDLGDLVCTQRQAPSAPRLSFKDDQGQAMLPEYTYVRVRNRVSALEFEAGDSQLELPAYLNDGENVELLAVSMEHGLWASWLGEVRELRPGLVVELIPMTTIRLRVRDSRSEPLPARSITVMAGAWDVLLGQYQVSPDSAESNEPIELLVPMRPLALQVMVGRSPEPPLLRFDSPPTEVIDVIVEAAFESLRGRVEFEGQPVPGARVSLHRGTRPGTRFMIEDLPGRFDGTAAQVTHSAAANGEFSLPWSIDLPAVLVVRAAGFPDRVIDLGPAPLATAKVVELQRFGRVQGTVHGATGVPLMGRYIALSRGALDSRTTRLDAEGNFAFGDVAPGAWHLRANRMEVEVAEGLAHWEASGKAWPGSDRSDRPDVRVIAEEVSQVQLNWPAPEQHTLQGRLQVDGVPMAGWRVDAYPKLGGASSDSRGATTRTDSQGRFMLEITGEGMFSWSANPPSGWPTIQRDVDLRKGEPDPQWDIELQTAIVEVRVGPHLSGLSYWTELPGGFQATGVLEDNQHQPTYRISVPAGLMHLWPRHGLYPVNGHGPFALGSGETLNLVLP